MNKAWLKGSAISALLILLGCIPPEAVKYTAHLRGVALTDWTDYVAFLPIQVPASILTCWLGVIASAGLFGMALRGEAAEFADYEAVMMAPIRWLWPAVIGSLISQAVFVPLRLFMEPMPASFAYLGLEVLTAPFYLLVIPTMVERGVGFGPALGQGLRLGVRHYFRFLFYGSFAAIRGSLGILLLGIGFIWTQPIYQREVTRLYRDATESKLPT